MAITTITISKSNGSIVVSQPSPILSKRRKDKVKWVANPQNLKFLVCFGDKTPFKYKHFGNVRPNSGDIKITPSCGMEFFKYSIEIGKKVLDPGIIIDR